MTINSGHSTGSFFIFGWKGARYSDGPYYVGGASTLDETITRAREALSNWPRTTAEDVLTGELVWDSRGEQSRQDGKTPPFHEMSER